MPANFARLHDLLVESGFPEPRRALAVVAREASVLDLAGAWTHAEGPAGVRAALASRTRTMPPAQQLLASLVPEWLHSRTGDLAMALWLARTQFREELDLPGYLLGVLQAFLADGRTREALAFARFTLGISFDWGQIYDSPELAYAFLKKRDPNPLVWKVLEELRDVGPLRVLELGCGIGNDAAGLLASPRTESYLGVDLASRALAILRKRAGKGVRPDVLCGDILGALKDSGVRARRCNLVYSYSSLHYFASMELEQILTGVRELLLAGLPEQGYFAFAIKGAGSVWANQGIALYRPDVWINWDGQSRWFPSREALARYLDRAGFEIRFHELHDHWGYSEQGKRDVFHYVLCSPRASFIGDGI